MAISNEPLNTSQNSTGLPKQVVTQDGSVRDASMKLTNNSIDRQMRLIGGKKYKKSKKSRKSRKSRKTRKSKKSRKTKKRNNKSNKKGLKGGNVGKLTPPTVPQTGASTKTVEMQQQSYNNLAKLSASSNANSKYDNAK